jgi:hypothetical protein
MQSDVEFGRLQDFVGIKLNDRRRPDLYRSRSDGNLLISSAAWLAHKQMGSKPEEIIEKFEALRER